MEPGHSACYIPKTGSREIVVPDDDKPEEFWCPRCRKYRLGSDFYRNTARTTGRSTYCKLCHNAEIDERRKGSV